MKRLLTLLIALALLGPVLAQQGPVVLKEEASARKVKLGESLRLTVQVTADPGVALKLPPADSFTFGPWEVRDAVLTDEPPVGGQKRWKYTFRLAPWEVGPQKVPPLTLSYQFAGERREASTRAVEIAVGEPEPEPKGEIRDFAGLDPLPVPVWVYLLVALSGLVTLALFWMGIRALRRTLLARKPVPELGPTEWTLRELDRLSDLSQTEQYERFTQVLRIWLARRHQLPVLERTTTEILNDLRARSFPPEQIQVVREVLDEGDLVKFARQVPGDAARRLDSVRQMVQAGKEEQPDA